MQAGAGGPALADQERAARLRERRGLRPHHCEMALLCAAGEETLGPIGRDGLETVDPAVDVLQRHDKPASCVHAQRERRGLLGDQIGMVVRGRACARPDSGGSRSGIVRTGWCLRGIVIGARRGQGRALCRWRLVRIVRRRGSWSGAPAETQGFVLVVRDPDAPAKPEWSHWIIKNIPADVLAVDENSVPGNATASGELVQNDFGRVDWGGPCPPDGMHRYFFQLYALDVTELAGNSLAEVEEAMNGHVLDKAELMATYQRPGQ